MATYSKIGPNLRLAKDYSIEHDKMLHGEAIIGFDYKQDPVTGISSLGEVVLRKKNEILMGGSLYALEKLFNTPSSLTVEYLNTIMGIGTSGPDITERYQKDHHICLWDVGVGGAGNTLGDVNAALQQHRSLQGMIPFRVVDAPFTNGTEEADKYWMMKQLSDGKYAYYAKTYDKDPIIYALWKDGADNKDGSPVVESDYNSTKTVPIETFAEVVLRLEVDDLREYFDLYQDTAGIPRFNTMGLIAGILSTESDGRPEYKQALQISALTFDNEPLHMEKDMYCIYRFYSK